MATICYVIPLHMMQASNKLFDWKIHILGKILSLHCQKMPLATTNGNTERNENTSNSSLINDYLIIVSIWVQCRRSQSFASALEHRPINLYHPLLRFDTMINFEFNLCIETEFKIDQNICFRPSLCNKIDATTQMN